ncbi:efflux RND transporter periplasmic adaptor subunit [Martelella mediterranea]|uniref:Macrolide-specific efflux protein MacA n=1 Tax=Martelella mediterranea DSM 17316 TaxID=1122214 RepID=A0A1U9YZ00_9HYPH|nr:efflux RND transporter periplasmic adaptor subunit [Martelella mediterranea]AQZ50654.1 Macrolide-specific efflux protein MacA precursor [Martelella mediterranea DSM 17316]
MPKPTRLAAATAVLIALAAAPSVAADGETSAEPAVSLPAIVVTDATVKPLTEIVLATGTIRPVEEVFVQPLLEGLSIETIAAEIGDRVEAGAVLATLRTDMLELERSSLQANKARAEASLAQLKAQLTASEAAQTDARRQFERTQRLADNGSVSTSALEQAETEALRADASAAAAREAISVAHAEIAVTEAQIDDIALRLERTNIKAPVSGVISDKNARIGAIASGSSSPMFTIIEDGAIELVAQVPEDSVMKVAAGQKAKIELVGAGAPIMGTVRLVSPIVNDATRLADVFISIDNPESARSGMYASAEIITKQADDLALPLTAVNISQGSATVRRVKDGIVEVVDVETGIQDGETVQITSGLSEGDQVVAKAGAYVRAGDRINPVPASATASN